MGSLLSPDRSPVESDAVPDGGIAGPAGWDCDIEETHRMAKPAVPSHPPSAMFQDDLVTQLAYKPHLGEVFGRLRTFYSRCVPDRILAAFEVHNSTLGQLRDKRREGFREYPDPQERVQFWDRPLAERAGDLSLVANIPLSEFLAGLERRTLAGRCIVLGQRRFGSWRSQSFGRKGASLWPVICASGIGSGR